VNRKILALCAGAPLAALPLLATAAPALADTGGAQTYTATLSPVPLNGQTSASGTFNLTLNGNVATIHEQATGLAATFMGKAYPHVQHIHGGAMGMCPTASADTNGDGVISTAEGQPSYGGIQTTLSVSGDTTPASGTNVNIAPSGSSFTYDRTITLDSATMSSLSKGVAVIVVHGLDPATAPSAAGTSKSELVPSLPLAATSPALCGQLVAATGAPATGGGSTAGTQDTGLIVLGGAGLAAAGGVLAYRRRSLAQR
jgi:hypothetical protein